MNVTITLTNGRKYSGTVTDVNKSAFFKVQWIKITVNTGGVIALNTDHVVSVKYGKTNRKEN